MQGMRGFGREVLFALLLAQATGCTQDVPGTQTPPVSGESGTPENPPANAGLSCDAILPATWGEGRSIVLAANGPEADCGPGTADGAGFLALKNSGPFGSTAWDLVSPEGVPTGNRMFGGDSVSSTDPQPSGFHFVTSSPGGAWLRAYSSDGATENSYTVAHSAQEPYGVVTDPQGGALAATWETRAAGTQTLTFLFLDAAAVPRTSRVDLVSAPAVAGRFVIAGVDTQGKALLLWPQPGDSTRWAGQWVDREGAVVTQPFTFPASFSSVPGLNPLAGGGFAVLDDGQWVARFASGASAMEPAPAWLSSHPGTRLHLIRGQRAHVLVPPPSGQGAGCQQSLLFFTEDGTACGESLLPPGGACEEPGIGWDGTVVQRLELGEDNTSQCSWRWWTGLLHP